MNDQYNIQILHNHYSATIEINILDDEGELIEGGSFDYQLFYKLIMDFFNEQY